MENRNNEFPSCRDKLFIREANGSNWLPKGIEDFFQMSEGYRMAGVNIYNAIKQNEWINKPFMACSMIFCFRQFLEVRLKELVYLGKKELFETPDFIKEHSLTKLFEDFVKSVLPKIDTNYDRTMVDNVRNLINEFNSIDPISMSFRYPVDKQNKASLNIPNLDIDNFKKVMDKLSNYFDSQLEVIALLQDFNAEMAAEYASYFQESGYY